MLSCPEQTLLFDGQCPLCTSSIRFIKRHDRHHLFKFVSIHSEPGRQLYKSQGYNPENIETFLLLTNTDCYSKSDAVIQIAKGLGGFWRLVIFFRVIPKQLRDWIYLVVARNRYCLSTTCEHPRIF